MKSETWNVIKNSKSFNVNIYRRGLVALIISLLLSCTFAVLLFYTYLSEPERDYYATNGVTPPVKLKALFAPNMSPQALLEPDPPTDNDVRVIPQ